MSDSDYDVDYVIVIALVLALMLFIGLCVFFVVSNYGNFDFDDFDSKSNTINSTPDFIITEKHLIYFNSEFPNQVYSVVDTETGVEYLTVPGEYMIPRYNTDGEIIIHQDLITTTFS